MIGLTPPNACAFLLSDWPATDAEVSCGLGGWEPDHLRRNASQPWPLHPMLRVSDP